MDDEDFWSPPVEVLCEHCGVLMEVGIDGDTEGGFYWTVDTTRDQKANKK